MIAVYQRILEFNKDRLPGIVKLKYDAMAQNAFGFYRGTCHLFYEDLSQSDTLPDSPLTWTCGDLHLENFGSFKGDNRMVYFDLNDFDESILAPCLWEVARMITSIIVGFELLKINKKEVLIMAQHFINHYAQTLSSGKAIGIEPRTAKGIVCSFLEKVETRKQSELLKKRTFEKKGRLHFSLDFDKYRALEKDLKNDLEEHIAKWIKKTPLIKNDGLVTDAIFRIAGTGSLGLKRYIFLLRGGAKKNKYLVLDMKQVQASSLKPYVTVKQPKFDNEAQRIIQVQQRMQNVPPALLDTTEFRGDHFVLKEMQPIEDRINFELISDRYKDIGQILNDMAILTASAQLRSSGRQGSAIADKLIAFGEDSSWHESLLKYAGKYGEQVKQDYQQYLKAYTSGQVE